MIVKLAAAAFLTALVTVLGEVIVRQNRRSRALREHLVANGQTVSGVVRTVDRVSAGKYGAYKIRALIDYQMGDDTHTHAEVWPSNQPPQLVPGDSIDLLVDPSQPASACVAGAVAPPAERDAPHRWFAVGVGIVTLVLALVM